MVSMPNSIQLLFWDAGFVQSAQKVVDIKALALGLILQTATALRPHALRSIRLKRETKKLLPAHDPSPNPDRKRQGRFRSSDLRVTWSCARCSMFTHVGAKTLSGSICSALNPCNRNAHSVNTGHMVCIFTLITALPQRTSYALLHNAHCAITAHMVCTFTVPTALSQRSMYAISQCSLLYHSAHGMHLHSAHCAITAHMVCTFSVLTALSQRTWYALSQCPLRYHGAHGMHFYSAHCAITAHVVCTFTPCSLRHHSPNGMHFHSAHCAITAHMVCTFTVPTALSQRTWYGRVQSVSGNHGSGTRKRVSGTRKRVSGTRKRVSGAWEVRVRNKEARVGNLGGIMCDLVATPPNGLQGHTRPA